MTGAHGFTCCLTEFIVSSCASISHCTRPTPHVTRRTSRLLQVQSAGKRRQQTSRNSGAEASSGGAFGSLLFQEAESGEADNHPWSWVRDYQRPPSRQLPPELALFLDNHPDDVNTSRQPSPHNCSDAGVSLLYANCFRSFFIIVCGGAYTSLYQEARARQRAAVRPLLMPKMTKASGMCLPQDLPRCAGFLNTT